MQAQWNVGDRIENRWEIHKILRGGMGIVYIVYDHQWREVFAIKTFQDEVFARNPGTADRFTLEARSWMNLDAHQNVVHARFVDNIRGKPFLFLEYVSGGDLGAWIGTPRLTKDLPQVLRFAIQFCDGMTHAIAKGVQAHRDIKPQNCLVTQDNILKVTDFGLAKVFDDTPAVEAHSVSPIGGAPIHLSMTGKSAGTCTHMAPEQFDDAKHVDVRADIYSFGVMLFQMLASRLPFEGRSWEEFARLHRTASPPPLASGQPSLDSIVRKCLAKAAADRYAGFHPLRDELASIYESTTRQQAPKPVSGRELNAAELANKGVALENLGRMEEALVCYDRALAIDPRFATAWMNKGNALARLESSAGALTCYDRALAIDPRHANAWHNKGVMLGRLGRSEEAIACSDRAIEIDPQHAEAWSHKGVALVGLRRAADALPCYDRAIAINPQFAEAWFNRGVALNSLGSSEEELACYDRAIAINPQFAAAWYNKGVALVSLGRAEEALACYDRAIVINPQHASAWSNKGGALEALRRHQEALACYDRALAIDPQYAKAWSNKAVALGSLGRAEEALACYDRALALDPQYLDAWHNKGLALGSLGRAEEALACYDRALALDPQYPKAWSNKAVALESLGRFEQALTCYDRALALNPRYAVAWYNKGATLLNRFRNAQEALLCFEEALRLGIPSAADAIAICRNMLARPPKTPI